MTNEHHDPASPASSPGASAGPDYEGFDPELPEHPHQQRKILGLSSVQIGASAMAAVTSALAASFFGVAGTLIGAAVGSVISTIAGAMYAESMRRAAVRLRDAQTVVVQRVPFGTGQHPAQVPSSQALTQVVPAARADETVVLPAATVAAQAPVAATTVSATAAPDAGFPEAGVLDVAVPSDAVPGTDVPGAALLHPDEGGSGAGTPDGPRPWWRRPVFALPVVGVAGFLIAIGIITGIEGLTGNTLSGGSGTSLSKIGGGSKTAVTPASTVTVRSTPAASASTVTTTPTAEATQNPVVPTTKSTATSSAAPDATTTTTAPGVTPTTSSVAPTSGVDAVTTQAPGN